MRSRACFHASIVNCLSIFPRPTLSVSTHQYFTNTMPVKSVSVVGGTHGNEYTGVWCIKALDRQRENLQKEYPSLNLSTILGNPRAHLENKRFVDQDLNRQFSFGALHQTTAAAESIRARELNVLLGPKFGGDSNDDQQQQPASTADVIIDLHTTTTNMGITLIVGEGDSLMTQAAAYVVSKCSKEKENACVLMHTHKSREEKPHLSSIARHSFSIEVGPVPQGVLRHDIVEKTQRALAAVLEFLERSNTEPEKLYNDLSNSFPSGRVPCYRSAPAKVAGEMSAKISWPSDPENPNFPAWMVHKNVQDKDFQQIRTGDPIFVDLDGNTIEYDGKFGSPVLLMFINEGGYYYSSSGTGISVARHDEYDLKTGVLVVP